MKHGGNPADNHGTIKRIQCRTKCTEKWNKYHHHRTKDGHGGIGTGQEELKNDIITRIYVIYWIQWHPREKVMVIHLDGLVPYLGATRAR
jgi:hypothetical protein